MSRKKRITGKKFKQIIAVCQDALKGKTKLEDADLLSFLPTLREEIQKGRFDFTSVKAFSLSSHVLDLKTRNLLGEFGKIEAKSKNHLFDKINDDALIESFLIYPVNSFREFILESDIIKAYYELLKLRKNRPDYSVIEKEEVCVQKESEFNEVDSFEQDKMNLFFKLKKSNKKVLKFISLQTKWEDAVTNLLYLVHLAQEGKIYLEQKFPNEQILIRLKN
ncbi:MAG: hypothetical protein HWN67_14590 [Candidatus Helarchaeota archaeon]|nr:hypothetical protein [Candidatus Helarchaeota archaeon]